LKASRFTS